MALQQRRVRQQPSYSWTGYYCLLIILGRVHARVFPKQIRSTPWGRHRASSSSSLLRVLPSWLAVPRGGTLSGDDNDENDNAATVLVLDTNIGSTRAVVPYTAVSIVCVGEGGGNNNNTARTTTGCLLIPSPTAYDNKDDANDESATVSPTVFHAAYWKENTPSLWESLAVASDCLVLVVTASESSLASSVSLDPSLVQALRRGLERRRDAHKPAGRLWVALLPRQQSQSQSLNPVAWEEWKERMVQADLAAVVTDSLVQSVELVQLEDYHGKNTLNVQTLAGMVVDDNNNAAAAATFETANLVDAAAFSVMLQQVHESLGGDSDAVLLQPAVPVEVLGAAVDGTDTEEKEEDKLQDTPQDTAPAITVTKQPVKYHTTTPESVEGSTTAASAATTQGVLETVHRQLDDLETQQEQVWLDPVGSMPVDFSTKANAILQQVHNALELNVNVDSILRQKVVAQVGDRLQILYQQQTQSLRDHFGRLYESALDSSQNAKEWSNAAAAVTDQFRKAAQQAVPVQARQGGVFRDMDLQYLGSLQGLVADMMEATESRQSLEDALAEHDVDESDAANGEKAKRPSKWYEKLAARAVVLGVNYFQGWLAWQGIKRAAIERDRNMPKFPLF